MLHALSHKDHQNVLSMFCMKRCQLYYVEMNHIDYSDVMMFIQDQYQWRVVRNYAHGQYIVIEILYEGQLI